MTGWHQGPMAPFDLETTGVDVFTDRIVSAFTCRVEVGKGVSDENKWLVNPGIPIPEAATAVHGITDEQAADGTPAAEAVEQIADHLAAAMTEGVPVVGWNLAYDLTLLEAELRRYDLPSLADRLGRPIGPVVDGFLLDKQLDRYRKGSRKLVDVAAHYGITLLQQDAHGAKADAMAAARVIYRIAQTNEHIALSPLGELHAQQQQWAAAQAASFREYLQRQGKPCDDVDGTWPVRPVTTAAAA